MLLRIGGAINRVPSSFATSITSRLSRSPATWKFTASVSSNIKDYEEAFSGMGQPNSPPPKEWLEYDTEIESEGKRRTETPHGQGQVAPSNTDGTDDPLPLTAEAVRYLSENVKGDIPESLYNEMMKYSEDLKQLQEEKAKRATFNPDPIADTSIAATTTTHASELHGHTWAPRGSENATERGMDAMTQRNNELAKSLAEIDELKRKIKEGCVISMNKLGDHYRKGRLGLQKDPKGAVSLYKKAAMAGLPDAQYNLGLCFYTGIGVEVNDDLCSKLLHEASNNGSVKAMAHLSQHYMAGEAGCNKDISVGLTLLKRAARKKHLTSIHNLGTLYMTGLSDGNGKNLLKKNITKAKKLFERAANRGDIEACRLLGALYHGKFGRHQEVNKDIREAIEWYTKSAMAGDAVSMYQLACIYQKGCNRSKLRPRLDLSQTYLEEAAARKLPEAQQALREAGMDDQTKDSPPELFGNNAVARMAENYENNQTIKAGHNYPMERDPEEIHGILGDRTSES